ncbi:zinc ABC transporter substrate-binding protein [Oculatella sp. LEGE 06141]|uniref:metal ABC transporter solute-binding protein, Zn/Mn family n=1 Tax=Oculatella sp. LEGE 06141 TaxID=1828648 RepID=UPI001882DAEA|nr:zinc ABC transporter substrate-binding protein [Oculatella sp. LEGE 06141]MBE9179640.1 zinc ABC transporter substrate-binding protein [Oculatella sp. LEGE 06141]
MHFNPRQLLVTLLLLPFFAVAGCTGSSSDPVQEADAVTSDEQLQVIATFLPMYLFTKAVAGEAADVSILIQPGTEVHEYQSTPADVRAIAQADVLVQNGLGMEEFLDSTLESAQNPELTIINASAGITPLEDEAPVIAPAAGVDDHDHEDEAHAHDDDHDHAAETAAGHVHVHAENPHVWLSPVLAIQQVETIRDGLAAADPANSETYEANAAAYIEQLQALDDQFQQRLQPFSDRTFISFHDAYPYLADRYNLQQVAIVALPEDSLTPDDLQKTIATVRAYDVKALFAEPGTDNRLLESLSQDLNLDLKELDPLEAGDLDPQYYFTAMEANLQTLESAFQ